MSFRCDRCARCCHHHVVPVTRTDVARLATHTHLAPSEFLELRAPEEVDIVGEPESLADLPAGGRLAVLAQKQGACIFLSTDGADRESCSVHAARPSSCRAYPFDRPDAAPTERPALGLHPGALCPKETGYLEVLDDQHESGSWASIVAERDRELHEHAEWVARFNRRQRLRRRLGKPRLLAADFLRLLAP